MDNNIKDKSLISPLSTNKLISDKMESKESTPVESEVSIDPIKAKFDNSSFVKLMKGGDGNNYKPTTNPNNCNINNTNNSNSMNRFINYGDSPDRNYTSHHSNPIQLLNQLNSGSALYPSFKNYKMNKNLNGNNNKNNNLNSRRTISSLVRQNENF